jgi:hypothetical protein
MSERNAKAIYYVFMLFGVALLGLATHWLKSLGTVAYIAISLLYLLVLAALGEHVYNRFKSD